MSIFDEINVKKIKDQNDIMKDKATLAKEREALYRDEQIRCYAEYVRGFADYAIRNNIPSRSYKGTELFSGSFKGWELRDFCVDIKGNYYKKIYKGDEFHPYIYYRKRNAEDIILEFQELVLKSRDFHYDTNREIIEIYASVYPSRKTIELPISMSQDEYISQIQALVRQQMKRKIEYDIENILNDKK